MVERYATSWRYPFSLSIWLFISYHMISYLSCVWLLWVPVCIVWYHPVFCPSLLTNGATQCMRCKASSQVQWNHTLSTPRCFITPIVFGVFVARVIDAPSMNKCCRYCNLWESELSRVVLYCSTSRAKNAELSFFVFSEARKRNAEQTMQRLVNNLNLLLVSFPTQLLCDSGHNVIAWSRVFRIWHACLHVFYKLCDLLYWLYSANVCFSFIPFVRCWK